MKRGRALSPQAAGEVLTFKPGLRNRLHQIVLDAAPDAIVLVNGHGNILLQNKAAEAMFGYSPDELHQLTVEDLLPESFASLHRTYRKGYMKSPVVRTMGSGLDLRGRRKDGMEFHIDIMLSPFRIGQELLIVAVIRDDTVKHKEKEALEELLRTLQAERAKVQTLKSLLPICAWCKKIRDDQGYWTLLEEYFHDHADVDFTHGICPDCARKIEENRTETGHAAKDST